MRFLICLYLGLFPLLSSAALSYDASIMGLILDNNLSEHKKYSANLRINQSGNYVYAYTRSQSEFDNGDRYTSDQFALILNESNSGLLAIEYNRFESEIGNVAQKEDNYRVEIAQFRENANVGYNYNSDPNIPIADPIGQATSLFWSSFFSDNALLDLRYVMPKSSSGLREGIQLGFQHAPKMLGSYFSYSFSIFRPHKMDPLQVRLGVKLYVGKAKSLKDIIRNKF